MLSNVLFSLATPYPAQTFPQQIVTGDFNGDGATDLFVPALSFTNDGSRSALKFYLGDGNGGFSDGTSQLFSGNNPTAVYAARVVTGDFNGDGRPDVLVLDSGADVAPFSGGQNQLLLSAPGGLMMSAAADLPSLMAFNHGAAVGDINNDGHLDAVVFALNTMSSSTPNSGPAIQVLTGDGSGKLTLDTSLAPASYQGTGFNGGNTWGNLIDVDGDGKLDLVAGTWNGSSLPSEVYLSGSTPGNYSAASPIALPDPGVSHPVVVQLVAANLNGDALPDLILSVTNGGPAGGPDFYTVPYLQFLVNDGGGHFHDETQARFAQGLIAPTSGTDWYKFVQLADVDGDGSQDLIVSRDGSTTDILLNDGRGHFSELGSSLQGFATPLYKSGDTTPYAFAVASGQSISVVENDVSLDAIPPAASGNQSLTGGSAGDVLRGGAGSDFILGLGGDDSLIGGGGSDTLFGNQGNDTILIGSDFVGRGAATSDFALAFGGQGDDLIHGGSVGVDQLFGNLGNDTIIGHGALVSIYGGQGNDLIDDRASIQPDYLSGDIGNDTIMAGGGFVMVFGGSGDDSLVGGSSAGPGSLQYLFGNQGSDHLSYAGGGSVQLFGGQDNDSIVITATQTGQQRLGFGNIGDDTLSATGGADSLYGGQGNDLVTVASDTAGHNYLSGDLGNDALTSSQGGADTLHGGRGADTITLTAHAAGSGDAIIIGAGESTASSAGDESNLQHIAGFASGSDHIVLAGHAALNVGAGGNLTTFTGGSYSSEADAFAAAYTYAFGDGGANAAHVGSTEYLAVQESYGGSTITYIFTADHHAVALLGSSAGGLQSGDVAAG